MRKVIDDDVKFNIILMFAYIIKNIEDDFKNCTLEEITEMIYSGKMRLCLECYLLKEDEEDVVH